MPGGHQRPESGLPGIFIVILFSIIFFVLGIFVRKNFGVSFVFN